MTATFGKLQGRSLELGDGLNIIEAPNETGKSTWCAFLLSILYGVNSRERDRAGFIADKNRFAPWSGAAMSGRMDCGTELGELTLTRATRRQTSPMGEFSAVYAGTNEPVPGLTGAACGETLLGISREVFERSAFIRQNNLPISQDAELERRIAALISSGEEGTSYTEAADALKKQLNRRRHNRTGQLPALGRRAAEIFSRLTDNRYAGVVLDRSFRLSAEPVGDPVFRDAALLSAGALDQLYLAVRLAICELVLPPEKQVPIVLDDALANFDDSRCAAALQFLKEAAGNRQILLFTCHSREGEFFAGDREVFVQRLTDAAVEV